MRAGTKHKTALREVSDYDALHAAWKFIFGRASPRSRNTLGSDDLCINDIAKDVKPYLRKLSQKLRLKEFKFSPLRPHFVPKAKGGFRLICVPTVEDRIVQRALLDFLNRLYGSRFANDVSYGFIRDRTVTMAAKKACQLRDLHEWAFKTDISAFFDRVDRTLLHARIKNVVRERSIHPLLIAAANCEIELSSATQKKRVGELGIVAGRGVRQGMPLSPFFANLFLESFDKRIAKRKLAAIRYADDLIFFGDSRQHCEQMDGFCRSALADLKLEIPIISEGSKTLIEPPDQAIEFLGLGLVKQNGRYQLVLLPKQREEIRSKLLDLGSISNLNSRQITLATLDRTIQSRIAGYAHAYANCSNIEDFEAILKDLHRAILYRIYGSEGLGLAIGTLSAEKRVFLGLS